MSRRDTIIIAVLINAGLLIVLFTTALKSDKSQDDFVQSHAPSLVEEPISSLVSQPVVAENRLTSPVGDEVDQLLKQYQQFSSVTSVEEKSPAVDQKDLSHFTDELKQRPDEPAQNEVSTQESAIIEVKVKKGDVLEKLARFHKTTVSEIMKLNRLTSSNLKIGQVLRIPSKAKKASAPTQSVTRGDQKYYQIKAGDTPWSIALKHQMKLEDLLALNNLDKDKARKLKAGDRLRVQ